MKRIIGLFLGLALAAGVRAQTAGSVGGMRVAGTRVAGAQAVQNVVVVTIDGCRWKEVFGGADSSLLYEGKFMKKYADVIRKRYWSADVVERRQQLMPFMWNTVASQGSLFGNRAFDNKVQVKNPYNISVPGYSEIYTGYADVNIKSNDTILNPNTNVFEFLNKLPAFKGKVASFISWDRGSYYLNEKRSGFPVNCGYEPMTGGVLSPVQKALNEMQAMSPISVSQSSRPDQLTYFYAKEYARLHHPRVLSLGFAYTDDMAHDGNYGFYLEQIHAFDAYIGDLWKTLQADPFYKGKTALLVTVDHGRGEGDQWTSHGPKVEHSNEIWLAMVAPGVAVRGEVKTAGDIYQYQIASTVARLLGVEYESPQPVGPAIELNK